MEGGALQLTRGGFADGGVHDGLGQRDVNAHCCLQCGSRFGVAVAKVHVAQEKPRRSAARAPVRFSRCGRFASTTAELSLPDSCCCWLTCVLGLNFQRVKRRGRFTIIELASDSPTSRKNADDVRFGLSRMLAVGFGGLRAWFVCPPGAAVRPSLHYHDIDRRDFG
jgi:hypothetical protein